MIKIQSLSKKYNEKYVVKNADALFPIGKLTSIIGPNGAGKSTLLSMASRLTKSDAGIVLIHDKPLEQWDNEELAKRLSVLKQSNNINMRFTVRDLVSFGRYPYSKGRLDKKDHEIVRASLEDLDILDLESRFIDELSGGQRQLAFIAMVVAQDTDYVFLDEPLNNLDIKHSVDIMGTLQKLAKEKNKAVVNVIHDINFASCYSDQIIAMKSGGIIKAGTTSEVIDETVLESIYQIPFRIKEIDGQRISLYY